MGIVDDSKDHGRGILTAEGKTGGQNLEKHDPQREDVGSQVNFLALNLFGRHIAGSSEERASLSQVGCRNASDPKIEELDLPVFRQHDVGGLDVTVYDAVLVGKAQPCANLQKNPGDRFLIEPVGALDQLVKSLSIYELHDDVRSVLVLSQVMDGNNVGVGERTGHPGLLQEASDELIATLFLKLRSGADLLDRDRALDSRIVCQIGSTLTSPADFFLDDVTPDPSFVHFFQRGHLREKPLHSTDLVVLCNPEKFWILDTRFG